MLLWERKTISSATNAFRLILNLPTLRNAIHGTVLDFEIPKLAITDEHALPCRRLMDGLYPVSTSTDTVRRQLILRDRYPGCKRRNAASPNHSLTNSCSPHPFLLRMLLMLHWQCYVKWLKLQRCTFAIRLTYCASE